MKQLLSLLLLLPLFMACSSDDDPKTSGQDYTSFVAFHNEDLTASNCVAGYKKDGKYIKIGDLGTLTKGKYSPEIKLTDNNITEIYIFTDYNGGVRFNTTFKLNVKEKNIIEIKGGGIGFTDKTDPTQYPQ